MALQVGWWRRLEQHSKFSEQHQLKSRLAAQTSTKEEEWRPQDINRSHLQQ